jgi:hypothetical protein
MPPTLYDSFVRSRVINLIELHLSLFEENRLEKRLFFTSFFFTPKSLAFGVIQRFCANSRNSGIGVLCQTEILWSFHKFWNLRLGSYRDSEVVPKNVGIIGVLGQTEILRSFQKSWNRCFGSDRDSVGFP